MNGLAGWSVGTTTSSINEGDRLAGYCVNQSLIRFATQTRRLAKLGDGDYRTAIWTISLHLPAACNSLTGLEFSSVEFTVFQIRQSFYYGLRQTRDTCILTQNYSERDIDFKDTVGDMPELCQNEM